MVDNNRGIFILSSLSRILDPKIFEPIKEELQQDFTIKTGYEIDPNHTDDFISDFIYHFTRVIDEKDLLSYIYSKIVDSNDHLTPTKESGTIIYHYIDEDLNPIKSPVTKSVPINTPININHPLLEGYQLLSNLPEQVTLREKDQTINIVFRYKRIINHSH